MLPKILPHMPVIAIVTSGPTEMAEVEYTKACEFGCHLKKGEKLVRESDARAIINIYKQIIIDLSQSNCETK